MAPLRTCAGSLDFLTDVAFAYLVVSNIFTRCYSPRLSVTSLDLTGVFIGDENAPLLAEALAANTRIETLLIDRCEAGRGEVRDHSAASPHHLPSKRQVRAGRGGRRGTTEDAP